MGILKSSNENNISDSTTIMILGGYQVHYTDIELLDFSGTSSSAICSKPANFPEEYTTGAIGAYLDGKLLLCGGKEARKICTEYNFTTQSWSRASISLSTERIQAQGVVLQNNSWIIIGGINYGGTILATSEILIDELFVPSLIWPEAVYGHCISQFNKSHMFIAGGQSENDKLLGSSYFLNTDTNYWFSTEQTMKYPRKYHVCGFAKDSNSEWHAVVAGGLGNLYVEVLSLYTLKWKLGPMLPFEMDKASGVQIIDSFMIIGGEHIGYCSKLHLCYSSNSIYKLNLKHDLWEVQGQEMVLPRSNHISIMLPSKLNICQPVCGNCQGIHTGI